MRARSVGAASAAVRRPVTSHALSTEDRNGRTGAPVPGHSVSTEPSCASYQLSQKPWWRSSLSTAVTVRVRARSIAPSPITPRPAAATVDHRPQPMLVGEVWGDWAGAPAPLRSILSVTRPKSVVIASIERYVSSNQCFRRRGSAGAAAVAGAVTAPSDRAAAPVPAAVRNVRRSIGPAPGGRRGKRGTVLVRAAREPAVVRFRRLPDRREPSGGSPYRGRANARVNQASARGSSRVRPSDPSHFAESRGVRSKVSQSIAIRPNVAL
ncbi:hypothetical protein GA0115253_105556 [Streptomyces sp. Termitarium-T10T-6]|nr:hypothetical protein GA0115253_105556 [Streptomyces sp. Termitarium-T10T-6]